MRETLYKTFMLLGTKKGIILCNKIWRKLRSFPLKKILKADSTMSLIRNFFIGRELNRSNTCHSSSRYCCNHSKTIASKIYGYAMEHWVLLWVRMLNQFITYLLRDLKVDRTSSTWSIN